MDSDCTCGMMECYAGQPEEAWEEIKRVNVSTDSSSWVYYDDSTALQRCCMASIDILRLVLFGCEFIDSGSMAAENAHFRFLFLTADQPYRRSLAVTARSVCKRWNAEVAFLDPATKTTELVFRFLSNVLFTSERGSNDAVLNWHWKHIGVGGAGTSPPWPRPMVNWRTVCYSMFAHGSRAHLQLWFDTHRGIGAGALDAIDTFGYLCALKPWCFSSPDDLPDVHARPTWKELLDNVDKAIQLVSRLEECHNNKVDRFQAKNLPAWTPTSMIPMDWLMERSQRLIMYHNYAGYDNLIREGDGLAIRQLNALGIPLTRRNRKMQPWGYKLEKNDIEFFDHLVKIDLPEEILIDPNFGSVFPWRSNIIPAWRWTDVATWLCFHPHSLELAAKVIRERIVPAVKAGALHQYGDDFARIWDMNEQMAKLEPATFVRLLFVTVPGKEYHYTTLDRLMVHFWTNRMLVENSADPDFVVRIIDAAEQMVPPAHRVDPIADKKHLKVTYFLLSMDVMMRFLPIVILRGRVNALRRILHFIRFYNPGRLGAAFHDDDPPRQKVWYLLRSSYAGGTLRERINSVEPPGIGFQSLDPEILKMLMESELACCALFIQLLFLALDRHDYAALRVMVANKKRSGVCTCLSTCSTVAAGKLIVRQIYYCDMDVHAWCDILYDEWNSLLSDDSFLAEIKDGLFRRNIARRGMLAATPAVAKPV